MSVTKVTQRWTESEKRFLLHICGPLSEMTADGNWSWEVVADQFSIEQERHLPSGDLHAIDPWPARTSNGAKMKMAYARIAKNEESRRQEAAHALLWFARGPAEVQEQVQVQVQEPNQDWRPQGSNQIPTDSIPIPEGSFLLPDGRIRLPSGRHLPGTPNPKTQ